MIKKIVMRMLVNLNRSRIFVTNIFVLKLFTKIKKKQKNA